MSFDSTKRDPVVSDALEFQKLSSEAFGLQRQREDAALEFQVPEKQWPAEVRIQRQGQTVQGVPIPARPMLSIPSLAQPIQGVYNQWANAHYGVQIHPQSHDADDETAEIMQGMYRSIEVDSRAYIGRGWGFDRGLKAGFGAYRVDVVYDEATDDPDDLKIVIKRILRQASVYWDPFAVEPDFCDQRRNLIVSFISRADFKREYPDASIATMNSDDLLDMQSQMPNWARLNSAGERESGQLKWYDAQNDTVCVAEYFYTEWVEENMLVAFPHSKRPKRKKPVIKWAKINAVEVLDSRTWNGNYIPIIPVIGSELQPFDAERRWQGMIEPNADSARLLNYEVSNAVETDALRPKAPFIGYVGQFKTNQAQWQLANVRNLSYLEADPVMVGGQLAPLPKRNETSVDLSSSIALIQLARESIQTGTNVVDATALEDMAKRRVAKDTIGAMQDGNAMSQSHFLQNMADITMTYEAKVVCDLIPKIYDRAGRVAQVLGENNDRREVMLNAPFVVNPKTKRPMQVPKGVGIQPLKAEPKTYDLTKGKYGIVVSVGKSYKTRAMQGSDALGEIIKGIPETAPVLLPIWMRFQDFPGHEEAEKALKKMQPPQLQEPEEGEEETIESVKAQRDQAAATVEQLSKVTQEQQKVIETDQIKAQAEIQKAQMSAQVDVQKAQLDNQTKLEIARMNAEVELQIAAQKVQAENARTLADVETKAALQDDQQRHEHAESALDRHHEHATLDKQTALAEAQADNQLGRDLTAGERQHEQAEESAENAAAREPKESRNGG